MASPDALTPTTDETARTRVQAATDQDPKLTNVTPEARWDQHGNVVLFLSKVTGARYGFDIGTCRFFRSRTSNDTRMTPCSPREVIHQDRSWLQRLIPLTPGGRDVLTRYGRPDAWLPPTQTLDATPKETQMVTQQAPAIPSFLIPVKTSTKTITMVEETKTVELAPHQVHDLLRLAGIKVPDNATISFTAQGYVRASWLETHEEASEK